METYFENLSAKEGTSRRLVQDLRVLLRDAESLVGSAVLELKDASRWDLRTRLDQLKASCARLERQAAAGARRADEIVRERPVQVAGFAFALGLFIGLCRRR
ncbi:MAG: DUF883 family protein [Verrucomicrobiales bacterium]|nr:DUF883 family protein [Verrucomicrobiales bacterium]MCP5526628.1 DUF883 family protein [Verrucomicrobiales bacterium]